MSTRNQKNKFKNIVIRKARDRLGLSLTSLDVDKTKAKARQVINYKKIELRSIFRVHQYRRSVLNH